MCRLGTSTAVRRSCPPQSICMPQKVEGRCQRSVTQRRGHFTVHSIDTPYDHPRDCWDPSGLLKHKPRNSIEDRASDVHTNARVSSSNVKLLEAAAQLQTSVGGPHYGIRVGVQVPCSDRSLEGSPLPPGSHEGHPHRCHAPLRDTRAPPRWGFRSEQVFCIRQFPLIHHRRAPAAVPWDPQRPPDCRLPDGHNDRGLGTLLPDKTEQAPQEGKWWVAPVILSCPPLL